MMHIAPLDITTHLFDWSLLLSKCFDRTQSEMRALINWLHSAYELIAWGAWDDDRLVGQYACLLRPINMKGAVIATGMSINMAVHPDYRGRGLVKQMAEPVYQQIRDCGGIMGMGFSNGDGVKVDKHSSGYDYRVIGQMVSIVAIPTCYSPHTNIQLRYVFPLLEQFEPVAPSVRQIGLVMSPETLYHRYVNHPFRIYQYGIWREDRQVMGIVVYRETQKSGVRGVTLLDAYGIDRVELLKRWGHAMRQQGNLFIHALTTPNASLRHDLSAAMSTVVSPITRTPHYLTVKPLTDKLPDCAYNFHNWDCTGGDIL